MNQQATGLTYRVQGVSRPGGHSRIHCNATAIKADTGSISDGYRPGPAELLCAALAACLLKNVERFAEILPFEYEVASVVVDAQRRDAPPAMTKMHYTLEVVTDEPPHRVDLLHHNVRKFGTITNTLAAAVELTGEIVARHYPSEIESSDSSGPSK
ncbi:MAG: OsmC family protein [Acidimicrobiia bacterium]